MLPRREAMGYVLVTGLGFTLWALLSSMYPTIFPDPLDALGYIAGIGDRIISDCIVTLTNTIAGYLLALGFSLVFAGLGRLGGLPLAFVNALNVMVQSVSALIWALAFLIIFGFTSRIPAIGVAAATAFPILLSGVLKGFETAHARYGEIAKIFNAPRFKSLLYIYLPASIPFIIASSRSAIGAALRISVVAEAFGGAGGIGYRLWLFYETHNYEGFFGLALVLVGLMVFIDLILMAPLERWSRKWLE